MGLYYQACSTEILVTIPDHLHLSMDVSFTLIYCCSERSGRTWTYV